MLQKFWRRLNEPATSDTDVSSLPAADQIHADDDVSAFMRPEVDEDRRREALRALFHKPKFNHRDGLDDYDEDYRLAHTGSRIGANRQS